MFTVKNNTVKINPASTYTTADCPESAAGKPTLAILNVANNTALINICIPNVPGNLCDIEDARDLVKKLFEDFYYDATSEESKLLGVTEVRIKTISLMPVSERQFLAWVTFGGCELESESDSDYEIPGMAEWLTSRGVPAGRR